MSLYKKPVVKCLSVLGTGSDVGKSIVTTALCRILKNRGIKVAPFKAQNMSNNSYVTYEGGEIGRAQVAQAEAAGCLPSVHMNPVLLKPSSDTGAQVVVLGKVQDTLPALDYYGYKEKLRKIVKNSFERLAENYEAIVIEGAGSCAEVNLRQNDIVNFDLALRLGAPVVLVADIDRGGVFAQIIGTLEIISQEERDLVAGVIINKFRGDAKLFDDGIAYIENKIQKPVFGVIPYYKGFEIDTEDSASLDQSLKTEGNNKEGRIRIAVLRLPYISNFTDIEALNQEPEVSVSWLRTPKDIFDYDAIILPGSKSVIYDLNLLQKAGWPGALKQYVEKGRGLVVGLCGGYQMLGMNIEDPLGIESRLRETEGMGLLNVTTRIEAEKTVQRSEGTDLLFQASVEGYEIHMGQTERANDALPFLQLTDCVEGAIAPNGLVFGTYLHGLFDSGSFRKAFLLKIAAMKSIDLYKDMVCEDRRQVKDRNYDLLASHFESNLDVDRILEVMEGNR